MDRNDFIEQIIGGVFAIIAIGAAVAELFINGISSASIAACIKDVFGTLAIVILFFAVMKDYLPSWSFEKYLNASLEKWEKENANMIVRKPEHDKGEQGNEYYSLDMKTDVSDFYDIGSHNNTGLFVRVPVINRQNYRNSFDITFTLNKGTFFGDIPDSEIKSDDYKKISERFISLINAEHQGVVIAKPKSPKSIVVTFSKGLQRKSDINTFIDVINTMYTSYLVSARIKVK